jgi:hypothetical protein
MARKPWRAIGTTLLGRWIDNTAVQPMMDGVRARKRLNQD